VNGIRSRILLSDDSTHDLLPVDYDQTNFLGRLRLGLVCEGVILRTYPVFSFFTGLTRLIISLSATKAVFPKLKRELEKFWLTNPIPPELDGWLGEYNEGNFNKVLSFFEEYLDLISKYFPRSKTYLSLPIEYAVPITKLNRVIIPELFKKNFNIVTSLGNKSLIGSGDKQSTLYKEFTRNLGGWERYSEERLILDEENDVIRDRFA
jgi:hypothetical protein